MSEDNLRPQLSKRFKMLISAEQLQLEMAARNERISALNAAASLPWHTDLAVEPGVVFGAKGEIVLVVDQWGDISDATVHLVAEAVADAVNKMFPVPEVPIIEPSAILGDEVALMSKNLNVDAARAQKCCAVAEALVEVAETGDVSDIDPDAGFSAVVGAKDQKADRRQFIHSCRNAVHEFRVADQASAALISSGQSDEVEPIGEKDHAL